MFLTYFHIFKSNCYIFYLLLLYIVIYFYILLLYIVMYFYILLLYCFIFLYIIVLYCYIFLYIINCPTRRNKKQSIYYSASSLYMFRVSTTPIIRSTKNCNYSLRYWSYILCSYLPPKWPSLVTLEGGVQT